MTKAAQTDSSYRVVFDLDDTLYAERDFAISGFRAAGAFAEKQWGLENPVSHMTELLDSGHLGKLFKLTLERFKDSVSDEDLAQFVDVYRRHEPEINLHDDARQALDIAKSHGPIGLITDGTHALQRNKVAALGIEPEFHTIVYTGALGKRREFHKPHPRAFEIMEAALGDDGHRLVYVGDNPAKDFIAPNQRGWLSVQIVRPNGIHDHMNIADGGEPHHRIHSLTELVDLLVD